MFSQQSIISFLSFYKLLEDLLKMLDYPFKFTGNPTLIAQSAETLIPTILFMFILRPGLGGGGGGGRATSTQETRENLQFRHLIVFLARRTTRACSLKKMGGGVEAELPVHRKHEKTCNFAI